ncbi:MAG: sugar transferase [Fusobacteriaceae bacterium]|jgi:lipopolysaccharide/colanic/teichoic acid biosynthesis glycosyltransferase|nr:sugar transferase [Fusobacteriaceae bacterium]
MYNFLKRFFDILLSLISLVILLPILVVICIILLITGEHKVFYFQKRIGYKNNPFYIWKFATMLKNSPTMGSRLLTIRKDPRVLPFGRFLRQTKLNELPQLINILKGDMSIVGPRPIVETIDTYPDSIRVKIYSNRPGLTGIGSVIFRDEEDYLTRANDPKTFLNEVIQPFKCDLEIWYDAHKSLSVDLIIIFLTAWSIIFPKNHLIYTVFKTLPQKNMENAIIEFNNK